VFGDGSVWSSVQPEGNDERTVELGHLRGAEPAAVADENVLGQREEVVAVHRAFMVETLSSAYLHFRDMAMERAGDQRAHQGRDYRDRGVTGRDDNRVGTRTGNRGIPDVAAGDQRSLAARHAAAENDASRAVNSS